MSISPDAEVRKSFHELSGDSSLLSVRRSRHVESRKGLEASVAWVAEDDPHMRTVVAEHLELMGFPVEKFADGVSVANELWLMTEEGRQAPDLIVLDVFMPGYSGLDLMALIHRGGFQVPVIAITGPLDAEARSATDWFGASRVLEKPFSMNRLREVVSELET